MSEGIVIALIGFVGAILGAAIAGFATVTAAGIKGKGESSISCGLVGLLASLGAAGGLVLGAVFGASLMQQRIAQPPSLPVRPTQSSESYDCMATVTISRPLIQNGTGETCWLKLADGAAVDIVFNDAAQITYRTTSYGNDVLFYIANKGDRLAGVVGGTIRPLKFVYYSYGSLENVKKFEIEYHSPGYQGGWVACLRDANNGYAPLNSVCK